MATPKLGTLQPVDLREAWPHEAHDFTQWLAKEKNLALLGDAIGIELTAPEAEHAVGAFSCDILAEDASTGDKVVIENQLEPTNHDHLGKVITYAAGTDAKAVAWVVAEARDEHRKAVEWLNDVAGDACGFFLVEVELWRIGDSEPAPRLNVVERPNSWAAAAKARGDMGDLQRERIAYWSLYRDMALADPEFPKVFKPRKPSADHWSTLSCGSSSYHLSLQHNTQRSAIGIEFYAPDDKEIGALVAEHGRELGDAIGLEPVPFEGKKASGVRWYQEVDDLHDQEKWPDYIGQQLRMALDLRKALKGLGL